MEFVNYKWTDGKKCTGQWQNNRMMGHGELTWHDGKWHVGDRNDNKMDWDGCSSY